MSMFRAYFSVLLAAVAATAEQDVTAKATVTPIEKVIKLLDKLMKESQEEGLAEAAAYDQFSCFCKAQADSKLLAIAKDNQQEEILSARIKKLGADINSLNVDIEETRGDIARITKVMAEKKAERNKERNEYMIKLADINEAIRGDEEAIELMQSSKVLLLQKSDSLREKVEAVFQRAAAHTAVKPGKSPKESQRVMAMLEFLEGDDPQGYSFHGGEIIETLQEVLKDFKGEKNKLQEEESSKKHEFDMAQAARSHQKQAFEDNVAKNEEMAAKKEEAKESDTAEHAMASKNKAADQAFLDSLVVQCEDTAKSWDQRSKTRANELMALAEASEIIKGKVAANYGANKKLVGLVSANKTVAKVAAPSGHGHWVWVPNFLQLHRGQQHRELSGGERKALQYLQDQAKKLDSKVLAAVALKLAAGEDHFAKVRTMIKDMIAKLEADAEGEQTQKGWCDEQMQAATEKRDENVGKIEGTFAAVTEAKASIAALKEEVQTLQEEIAELYKNLKEATELRTVEKEENAKTVKDATAGLHAVQAATQVLKDFYESFAQIDSRFEPEGAGADGKTVGDLAPKTGFEGKGEYKGKQDAASGIIGLMEVITSDFERTITETEDGEKSAQQEYEHYKTETDSSISEKKEAIKESKTEASDTEATLVEAKDDMSRYMDLKKEALDELAKLKPACVSTGSSYAERVARREQEIESLKNAYQILSEMSFLQK